MKLIAQYHPAAALHQPRLWAVLLDDWQNMPEVVPHDYQIYLTDKLNLQGIPLASMDTETDNAGGMGQWSVAYRDGEGTVTVVPFYGAKKDVVWGSCPVVMHNAKYDLRELDKAKMPRPENFHDSMVMAYCLGLGRQAPKEDSKTKSGSDMVGGLGLKYLARRHLGMDMMTWEEVKEHPDMVPEYNAKDSVATYLLAEKWLPKLPKHYFTIDRPLLPVLMAIEDRGIQVDPAFLQDYAKELDNQLANFDLPLNPFAMQEIASYIYGTLGIEPEDFTDTGVPSTAKEVLEKIDDPLVKQIIEFKELYKEKGTYVDNYINSADAQGRIHPEIKQTSTSTGRLSVARPNLQNVFKRDERVALRALFVAKEGYRMVRMDYDQMEWRALAAITQDSTLVKALESGKKIHQVTADQMGISYDDAKTGNFAIQYGAQAWKLAQELHCTIGEAKDFIKTYFDRFPGVKKYQDMMKQVALDQKKVTNYFGRTRRVDAMYSDQWRIKNEGIKEAINMPIQGACAEVVKIAMIELHKCSAPMILQVHDELLFEVPEKEAEEFGQWVKEFVPTLVDINGMRFPVDVSIGKNWYECTK